MAIPFSLRILICSTDGDALARRLEALHAKVQTVSELTDLSKKVRAQFAHACIIDYQMLDDSYQAGKSDIFDSIASQVAPAVCIILCHDEILSAKIEASHRSAILMSSTRAEELPEKIFKALDFTPPKHLQIEPQEVWEDIANQSRFNREEMHWVLTRLLSHYNKIRIRRYHPRPKAVIITATLDDTPYPVIIKIAATGKIYQEVENYRKFIHHRFSHANYAYQENFFIGHNCGAILSTRIGGGERESTFRDYYGSHRDSEITEVLENLFTLVLKEFYQDRHKRNISIYEAYAYLEIAKILTTQKDLSPIEGLGATLPNPFNWVIKNKHACVDRISYSPSHGDLWSDNIIIEGKNPWLIDFERAGEGHILRDFVELEADIVTRLLGCDDPLKEDQFIVALLLQNRPENPLPYINKSIKTNPRATKAFKAIAKVRFFANKFSDYDSMAEYYWALLMDCLFLASKKTSSVQQTAQRYAAWLCLRLENLAADPQCDGPTWLPEVFREYAYSSILEAPPPS